VATRTSSRKSLALDLRGDRSILTSSRAHSRWILINGKSLCKSHAKQSRECLNSQVAFKLPTPTRKKGHLMDIGARQAQKRCRC
jgi:hypothetical protein